MNYLVIDGNSVGHFAQNGSRLTLGDTPVHAIYHFLRVFRSQLAIHTGYQPIVLWDGASWRKTMYSDYKANREKRNTPHEIRQAENGDEYRKQLPAIKKALQFLGVPQVHAFNMEADDLAAIIVDKFSPKGSVVLLTLDKDWIQLVGPNVTWRDFKNERKINLANFKEKTGVETPKQFIEVKALSGDNGDNISGVGGIGEKGAKDFLAQYESFSNFLNMVCLERTVDFSSLPKKLKALVEDEQKAITFDLNLKLMDLRTTARPAPINLRTDAGEPCREKFRIFCDHFLFQSITRDLDEWIRVFPHFRNTQNV